MNAIEIVKAGLSTSESGRPGRFAEWLSDDMVFAGPLPQPVGKREFVGLQSAMVAAMPDWKYNGKDFKQDGETVTATFQISGTQTAELNLPIPGFIKVPASGKHISLPEEGMTFTVKNGKITRIESAGIAGGGVAGVLTQLGASMPKM
jgi:predicted ester cyclase